MTADDGTGFVSDRKWSSDQPMAYYRLQSPSRDNLHISRIVNQTRRAAPLSVTRSRRSNVVLGQAGVPILRAKPQRAGDVSLPCQCDAIEQNGGAWYLDVARTRWTYIQRLLSICLSMHFKFTRRARQLAARNEFPSTVVSLGPANVVRFVVNIFRIRRSPWWGTSGMPDGELPHSLLPTPPCSPPSTAKRFAICSR